MKVMHLICNAHLDPVWLWDWEEGAAAAISTFRSAAALAEKFDYIFCHNEAILYQWIEEYDPALFARIQELARAGKWKVMGGWYLQPDCCIPTGESLVRQMMEGRRYFDEKLGQHPTTAVNVDPFSHGAGLPQLLRGCGYDSYLICRPTAAEGDLPDDFQWEGPDGSTVRVCRAHDHYNSPMGGAADKIRQALERDQAKDFGIVLWGVGNHGGGPSRKDLEDIAWLMAESETRVLHSAPEAYMAEPAELPRVRGTLRSMPGCYSSMAALKQRHRLLESRLYQVEKMCSAAALQAGMTYPRQELAEIQRALMTAEFHDILPGSGIPAVEETGTRMLDYGLEIAGRLRMRALMRLAAGEKKGAPGEYPVLVYNAHPYPVQTVVDLSFILENQNWEDTFTDLTVYDGDRPLPTQVVKEPSNLSLDWAKRVVFSCTLRPMALNRFDCKARVTASRPELPRMTEDLLLRSERRTARISMETGLLDYYEVDGKVLLEGPAAPVLCRDNADPWAMNLRQLQGSLARPEEAFRRMTPEEAARYAGSPEPVRIIEDGPVMTEVESLLCCRSSAVRINWRVYRDTPDIDVTLHVLFLEKDALVKWQLPLAFPGTTRGQVAYGQETLTPDGRELAAQDWVCHAGADRALAVFRKGSYGLDCTERELHLTLVRGCAYAAHPIPGRELIRGDRWIGRMDQGYRSFRFRLTGGESGQLARELERRAQEFAEEPFCLQAFPGGEESQNAGSLLSIDGDEVVMTAFKASDEGGYILRLFNNTSHEALCRCRVSFLSLAEAIRFRPYEVRTFRLTETGLTACPEMAI